jgi:antitoxin component of MazEF toxin-antitoxin module
MIKRLSGIGSSKGLILDKTLLGLLGIEDGAQEVSVEVEGRKLIVQAVSREAVVGSRKPRGERAKVAR